MIAPKISFSGMLIPKNYLEFSKTIRIMFILFGIGFVFYGFYRTMVKVNQGNVLIREEVHAKQKHIYPSITFCYKFKHGTKDVLRNYYPLLYKKWQKSGKEK